ncbi:MAG: hypothetical protein LBR10_12440 [Prevotellaceae bacterium]|jgi:hypothetical protein|nr:hypothetical protein [Prevotellaceae bacterium]
MSTVYHSSEYKTAEDFYNFLINQCAKATENKDYLVTALLAYDATNPELVELFSKPTLWKALDDKTGDNIILFYLDFINLIREEYEKKNNSTGRRTRFPSSPVVGDLVGIDVPEDETPASVTSFILEKLGYDDYSAPKTPFVVLLQIENNNIVRNFCYHLDYENMHDKDAYIELLKLIQRITKQISKVQRNEDMDYNTVFNLAVQGTDNRFEKKIKWFFKIGKTGLEIKGAL